MTSLFLPPFDAFSDEALLAHFRAPRAVRLQPVVDVEETQPAKMQAVLRGHFEFAGRTHHLPDPVDWLNNPDADVEWHILLHKFYYAVGLGLAYRQSGQAHWLQRWTTLIESWMRTVPPGFIAADVTGRRVQNWIYSWQLFVADGAAPAPEAPGAQHGHALPDSPAGLIDPAWHRRFLVSLHEQVEYLCAHLTPKRNHRTLELLAIVLAGVVFPEMRRAAHWREFGVRETLANVQSDLLADGVHCELSTDYHHLALKNWLIVRRLLADNTWPVPAALDDALQRALEFSLHVHKPDGEVPSLSDGDVRCHLELLAQGAELFGREDMRWVASGGTQGHRPAGRVAHFASSGYTVLRSGWAREAQYLVFDSGPLGEGNHGHFDALSFELAAYGRSLIVDPGRYTYAEAPEAGINWRVHFRGTAAHNTVCVDGRQQTRYQPRPVKDAASRHTRGSLRHKISGPAAEAQLRERFHGPRLDLLHGCVHSHEYDAVHERCVVFIERRWWIVSDWLRAPGEHDYVLNFQLAAPAEGATTLVQRQGGVHLHSPGLLLAQPLRAGQQHTLAGGWVSARYGHKQPAPALRSHVRARHADFDTLLVPWGPCAPTLHELRDLRFEADHGAQATALRIVFEVDGARRTHSWFHARGAQARQWHHGPLAFQGRWLHWQEDAAGQLLRATSHAGATLLQAGRPVVLEMLQEEHP